MFSQRLVNIPARLGRALSTGPKGAGKPIEGILATCMDANIDGIPSAFPYHHKLRFAGGTIPLPLTCPQIDNSIRVATTDNIGKHLIANQKMIIMPHGYCKSARMSLQGLISDSVMEKVKIERGIKTALCFEEAIKAADECAKSSAIISIENAKLYGFKEQNLQSCFFNYFTQEVLILDKKFRKLDYFHEIEKQSNANGLMQEAGVDAELLQRLLNFRKLQILSVRSA